MLTPTSEEASFVEPADSSVIDGEITPMVRFIRMLVAILVVGTIAAGVVRGFTSDALGVDALVDGLLLTQVGLAMVLIMLGSFVEGFGFGLSLGTNWPYTRNIFVLLMRGDPEAAHRLVATLVGVIGVSLVVLVPQSATISGLALIVATALFGVGTLYVLAGRLPSVVHGVHGLFAYGVLLAYLSMLVGHGDTFWNFLRETSPLHAVMLIVLLGGMTTGQRGFGTPIGEFIVPQRMSQWVFVAHFFAALALVALLASRYDTYAVALYLLLGQLFVGFLLFHAVNLKPKAPGLVVAFHQAMVLAITVSIVVT